MEYLHTITQNDIESLSKIDKKFVIELKKKWCKIIKKIFVINNLAELEIRRPLSAKYHYDFRFRFTKDNIIYQKKFEFKYT